MGNLPIDVHQNANDIKLNKATKQYNLLNTYSSESPVLFTDNIPRSGFKMQDIKKVNKVVVHATDTPDDWDDFKSLGSVYDWHVNKQKWSAIGYHYLIGKDGMIYQTRSASERGAHAKAKDSNINSLGIAFIGSGKSPTESQLNTFRVLANALQVQLPSAKFIRHRDVDPNRSDVPFELGPLLKQAIQEKK